MKVGYARVSTDGQDTALQIDALKAVGCQRIYQERGVSGAAVKRPQLTKCLRFLQPGDVLVVWKLDRLGRSLSHLLELAQELRDRGVGFSSLSEALDTTTPQGVLIFQIMGALAQFERALLAERTAAGRAAAKKRGVRFGRPRRLTDRQIAHAGRLASEGVAVPEIADLLNVSRATAYRVLALRST